MESQVGEEPPPNGGQRDSRLKSKKPPSLTIAIPPPDNTMSSDPARQLWSLSSLLICRNAAEWFGVGEDCETKQQVWHRKSLRHCSQRYGKLKAQYREPETASTMDQNPDSPATTKLPRVGYCVTPTAL
ncbi:hypothetical protein GOODEAATRI_004148 [Goodea atripinnis]|uniref:Inactive rhomboid protein n=1 Tax=Goodea atripinnis TaxID=208336 RepID=A0ABV0PKV4_9TELE